MTAVSSPEERLVNAFGLLSQITSPIGYSCDALCMVKVGRTLKSEGYMNYDGAHPSAGFLQCTETLMSMVEYDGPEIVSLTPYIEVSNSRKKRQGGALLKYPGTYDRFMISICGRNAKLDKVIAYIIAMHEFGRIKFDIAYINQKDQTFELEFTPTYGSQDFFINFTKNCLFLPNSRVIDTPRGPALRFQDQARGIKLVAI